MHSHSNWSDIEHTFNTGASKWLIQGIYTVKSTLASHGSFWLVSDVQRWSGSGLDVTGPDFDLNFPDTHFGCGTGLRLPDVAMDRRPTEKKAPAGELTGFTALGTHKACQWPSRSPA